jgi:hypothetical protein
MRRMAIPGRLPVILPPHPDELLSSWISRHAAFYAVPPLVMLRHCLPEACSLRTADLRLTGTQEIRLASMFATEQAAVRRMTFGTVAGSSRRLIAVRPQQCCPTCSPRFSGPVPTLKSQLLGWRVTCPLCGDGLRDTDGRKLSSPFHRHHDAALRGERPPDVEAQRRPNLGVSGRNRPASPDATRATTSAT